MKKFIKLNLKNLKKIIIAIICITIVSVIIFLSFPYIRYCFKTEVTNELLDSAGIDNYNNLMIVAHPDDEALWGGHSLLEKDYFVVCLTNGYNSKRSEEFYNVLDKSGDGGIILDYPDKINRQRCDWEFCKDDIIKDLQLIISYKNWDTIVTHNEAGEYGHLQHIKTHEYVSSLCDSLSVSAKQYYFGTYHTKKSLLAMNEDELPSSLSTEELIEKYNLVSTYVTQAKTIVKLGHMIPFENFIERQ